MIKIDDHCAVDLDALGIQHFTDLNPRNQPRRGQVIGDYSARSLVGRIKTQKAISTANQEQTQVDFWDYLLDNNEANLRRIIISRPDVLKALIAEIEGLFTHAFFSNDNSYTDATLTPFGDTVKTAFGFETLYRSKDNCVHNFQQLNLRHCPYCNMFPVHMTRYRANMGPEAKNRALHQLDHFYPQSRHPYLAVSFFNLIPSCSVCNGQYKLERKFDTDTHFNPYQRRLDDHFIFEVNTVIPQTPADLRFSRQWKNGSNYSDQALTDFQILFRFEDNVQEPIYDMIRHFQYYGPAVTVSAMLQLPDLFDNELKHHESVLNVAGVPYSRDQINNYSLGKLKRDICQQMDLL